MHAVSTLFGDIECLQLVVFVSDKTEAAIHLFQDE